MDSINLPSQNPPSDIREMARTLQLSWWEGGGIVSLAEKTGGHKARVVEMIGSLSSEKDNWQTNAW